MNTDYKIFAKILATRIDIVLPKLVHPMQTGFIKGRNISGNIKFTNTIDYCNAHKINPVLISFDFEKAFDSDAIDKILQICNFGTFFCKEVTTLYKDSIRFCVVNNGNASEWFSLSRSCRQGCPLSAKIFDLIIECLGDKIRGNEKIKGILIDDPWRLLIAEDECVSETLMELEKFCLFPGLRINTDKTSIIRTGEWPDMTQKINAASRLRWTLVPIKI